MTKHEVNTKRRSRTKRPRNPQRMTLTHRDKEILARVWQDRMLYTSQVERIFFPSPQAANVRLRRLWENGYVERYFLPTLIFHGSSEALYVLDRKGADIVSVQLGIERAKILQGMRYLKWKTGTSSFLLTLDHTLATAEFRIAFQEAAMECPEMRYCGWIPERLCQEEYRHWNHTEGNVTGKFRPDGFSQYEYEGRLFSFFVEVDLATMSNKAFARKVQRYLDYSKSGRYQDRFGTPFFRVLVATVGSERLKNLKQTTEKLTDSIFWFTTLGQVNRKTFFRKVWQRAGKDGLHSLLDK
jgi:hypothetical protein